MHRIFFAQSDDEIRATYPLMTSLYARVGNLKDADYLGIVRAKEREVGYRLACLAEEGVLFAAAGFHFERSLSGDKYMHLDDLVTDPQRRSTGAGKKMLDWLCGVARAAECGEIHLDCRIDRSDTHRFYFREGMYIKRFHFMKAV